MVNHCTINSKVKTKLESLKMFILGFKKQFLVYLFRFFMLFLVIKIYKILSLV